MKELLKKADECINIKADNEVAASSGAEYPAMFLYVGDKAAEDRDIIRKCLKQKFMNGGSITHVVMRELSSARYDDVDLSVEIGLPDDRGDSIEYILGDDGRLSRFNDAARKTAEKMMMSSGFPQMSKCFLFIVTSSDCPLNAVLPEFVMLFSENIHIRLTTFLFVGLGAGTEGMLGSAAFFRELEVCQNEDFVYDSRIMLREDQRISVHHEGTVFDSVFFLEMYRSDMKFCQHNRENNARIAALTAVLQDREDPISMPRSVFYTAGMASAQTPKGVIAHIMFGAVINMIVGQSKEEPLAIPFSQYLGYDVLSRTCDRIMLSLPDVGSIVSVMPKVMGKDPDAVHNTNIRNILEYYGGEDEEFFNVRFGDECMRMADCCESISISDIFGEYINKGAIKLGDIPAYLARDGALTVCLGEVTERLGSEEEALTKELDELLSQPCSGLSHGLFSKPTGCEILAAAVSQKYGKMLGILRVRMMKRLVSNIMSGIKEYSASVTDAVNFVKTFSDKLSEELLREIYDNGSTLTDASAFTAHYTEVIRRAVENYDRSGSITAILKGCDLYSVLMNCRRAGVSELTDIALDIYRRLTAMPDVSSVFSMNFDEELYARYRDYEGGKDAGWVDSQLVVKLTEESRANLRYSVFQPSNSLYCMGNDEIGFVKKMTKFEDPAFNTVFVGDVKSASYEQLAIYNVPSPDSVVYINECRKVYDGYAADNSDKVYIDRSAERTSV